MFNKNIQSVFWVAANWVRIAMLKFESLEVRRLRHDLILTYKTYLCSLIWIKVTFTCADRTHSTRGHAYKLLCRVDVRKCFIVERVENSWNSLPAELRHFSSLSVFKPSIFTVYLSEFVTYVSLAFTSFSWHVSGRFRSLIVCFQTNLLNG